MMLAASAQAVEAKYSSSDLPTLAPEEQHATAAKRVASRLTRSHYKHFNLDDQFSEKIYDRYIEMLDYNRSFLTASDIKQFDKWQDQFDDQLKAGDSAAAYDIFNKTLERRLERYQYALTLLDKPITFTTNEEFVIDRSELPWAKDSNELNEIWRQRVKYDALNLKLAGKDEAEIKKNSD